MNQIERKWGSNLLCRLLFPGVTGGATAKLAAHALFLRLRLLDFRSLAGFTTAELSAHALLAILVSNIARSWELLGFSSSTATVASLRVRVVGGLVGRRLHERRLLHGHLRRLNAPVECARLALARPSASALLTTDALLHPRAVGALAFRASARLLLLLGIRSVCSSRYCRTCGCW